MVGGLGGARKNRLRGWATEKKPKKETREEIDFGRKYTSGTNLRKISNTSKESRHLRPAAGPPC